MDPIKTVEFRKFKHMPSLSEETQAFTADLYFDGKKVGTCSNHGTGGANDVRLDQNSERERFSAFIKAQPPYPVDFSPKPLTMTQDFFLSLLVEKEVRAREAAKLEKKLEKLAVKARAQGLVVLVVTFPGSYVTVACTEAETQKYIDSINKKHGWGQTGKIRIVK